MKRDSLPDVLGALEERIHDASRDRFDTPDNRDWISKTRETDQDLPEQAATRRRELRDWLEELQRAISEPQDGQ